MDYTVVYLEAFSVMGISKRTENRGGKAMYDIPLLWDRFYKENLESKIPYRKNAEILGVYLEYEKDFQYPYTFLAGCEVGKVEKIPEGLIYKQLPASHYARFTTQGLFPECLIQTWEMIWSLPLKRTYTGDFERYGEAFFGNPQNPTLDIYIAVESTPKTA